MIAGISSLILHETPLADFFVMAKESGYKCVELFIGRDNEFNLGNADEKAAEINSLIKEHGLPVVSLVQSQCTGNLLARGEAQKKSVEETIRGLEAAGKIGARCALHTLGRLEKEVCYDEAFENAEASLREIEIYARKYGVALAVEFVWNGFLFSPLEMKTLLDRIGSEYVGFYFDPGNMAVFQYPQHWVRILGKHIKMVHMKDWAGNALNGSWPALLKGEVDFAAVMSELRNAGYDGPLVSEVDVSMAALAETRESIEKIMKLGA